MMEPVRGHVRLLRDLTDDDWGDIWFLLFVALTGVQLWRLAS